MSKLEKLSDRFLRVGRHPFKIFQRKKKKQEHNGYDDPDLNDTQVCLCCHSDSQLYSRCWPLVFVFSAITDYPMPLPKGKKPGQHRDWGWIPILFVSAFSVYVYYAYFDRVILVLLNILNKKAQAIVYLVGFNILFLMYIISYARIVSKKPGTAKNNGQAVDEMWAESKITAATSTAESSSSMMDPDQLASMKVKPDSILGDPKWCTSCQLWKPDRTHHCRVCDACVMRMDHHCPWVNGCIGVENYRYYIQFLCYVSGLCTWIFTTSLAAFIQYNSLSTFDRMALSILIISGIITVVIGTFTLSHLWLVLLNRTTIENSQFQSWRKARKNGSAKERLIQVFTESGRNVFNQGHKKNWIEVMGNDVLLWFLPLSSQNRSDGVHFGYNTDVLAEYKSEDASRRAKSITNDTISQLNKIQPVQ